MIPKIIHYCWFGDGEKPQSVINCIESWKKYMPDFIIKEWNEKNFQSKNQYYLEAISLKKYAFASDFARLKILYDHGGVYFDTDVELIRDLNPLLNDDHGFMGFENKNHINTGLGFACKKNDLIILQMLNDYNEIHFINNGIIDTTTCPQRNTAILVANGLILNNKKQTVGELIVYPKTFFCPMDYDTGRIKITESTYTIHHYSYSWADEKSKNILKLKRIVFKFFPKKIAQVIFNILIHIRRMK